MCLREGGIERGKMYLFVRCLRTTLEVQKVFFLLIKPKDDLFHSKNVSLASPLGNKKVGEIMT